MLNHEFGRLYVDGYQNDEGTGVLKALATPKHFVRHIAYLPS